MEFDKATTNILLLDMETRFKDGEIRSFYEYRDLLNDHKNHCARVKTLEKFNLFERAMNDCIIRSENDLKSRSKLEILEDFIKE